MRGILAVLSSSSFDGLVCKFAISGCADLEPDYAGQYIHQFGKV